MLWCSTLGVLANDSGFTYVQIFTLECVRELSFSIWFFDGARVNWLWFKARYVAVLIEPSGWPKNAFVAMPGKIPVSTMPGICSKLCRSCARTLSWVRDGKQPHNTGWREGTTTRTITCQVQIRRIGDWTEIHVEQEVTVVGHYGPATNTHKEHAYERADSMA